VDEVDDIKKKAYQDTPSVIPEEKTEDEVHSRE
jgi:hypothetical protein